MPDEIPKKFRCHCARLPGRPRGGREGRRHALQGFPAGAKVKPQWMIVSSLYGLDKDISGLSPLFSGFIIPRYAESDLYEENWKEQLSKRTLISVKYKDRTGWSPMPVFYVDPNQPLPEKYESVLENVEKIKIAFPLFKKKVSSAAVPSNNLTEK